MSNVPAIQIVRLDASHDVSSFDSDEDEIDSFITDRAKRHQEIGYSATFVAVHEGDSKVVGYVSLSASCIKLAEFEDKIVRGLEVPFFPMPTLHVGRIGVTKKYQGNGIGSDLLQLAFQVAIDAHEQIGVGIFAVDLHLANEKLQAYYPKFGFKPVKRRSKHYYLPLGTIRTATEATKAE